MNNLKKTISMIAACAVLFASVSFEAVAQTNSKRRRAARVAPVVCTENDEDCFIQAAETCRKASVTLKYSTITLNVFQTSGTTYQEIRGARNGSCTYYFRYEKADIKFTEEFIRKMKERGETQEEIEQKEKDASESVQSTRGKYGICTFKTERFVTLLKKWKTGAFSYPDDWQGGNCRGTMFDLSNTK
jgi:hypothetical protein